MRRTNGGLCRDAAIAIERGMKPIPFLLVAAALAGLPASPFRTDVD
jgi:hypothetical protein